MSDPNVSAAGTKLDEYDKVEWYDVARVFKPELTWEAFTASWDEFQRHKQARAAAARLAS